MKKNVEKELKSRSSYRCLSKKTTKNDAIKKAEESVTQPVYLTNRKLNLITQFGERQYLKKFFERKV